MSLPHEHDPATRRLLAERESYAYSAARGMLSKTLKCNRDRPAKAHADFVDANDAPLQIDERTSRVAAVNLRVVTDPPNKRTHVLTFLAQRYIVAGLTQGSVKG